MSILQASAEAYRFESGTEFVDQWIFVNIKSSQ